MAGGRKLSAAGTSTPGPWLVCSAADKAASPRDLILGLEPATGEAPGGGPHLIRRAHTVEPGGAGLPLATGIQHLADARLMAAAPDLAAMLLCLLTTSSLTPTDLDPRTRAQVDAAWTLLVRAAPHLEI